MKNIKQITLIFALGMASASMFSSCERDEPVINPNPITPTDSVKPINPNDTITPNDTIQYRDIELFFSRKDNSIDSFFVHDYYGNRLFSPTLIRYDSMPDVRYIYMVVGDDSFGRLSSLGIHHLVTGTCEPVITFSKKIRGKGTFYFYPSEISKLPDDSLWITKQGWTIKSIFDYER